MFQTYMVSNNSSSLHSILPSEFALGNSVSHSIFSEQNRVLWTRFVRNEICFKPCLNNNIVWAL